VNTLQKYITITFTKIYIKINRDFYSCQSSLFSRHQRDNFSAQ